MNWPLEYRHLEFCLLLMSPLVPLVQKPVDVLVRGVVILLVLIRLVHFLVLLHMLEQVRARDMLSAPRAQRLLLARVIRVAYFFRPSRLLSSELVFDVSEERFLLFDFAAVLVVLGSLLRIHRHRLFLVKPPSRPHNPASGTGAARPPGFASALLGASGCC